MFWVLNLIFVIVCDVIFYVPNIVELEDTQKYNWANIVINAIELVFSGSMVTFMLMTKKHHVTEPEFNKGSITVAPLYTDSKAKNKIEISLEQQFNTQSTYKFKVKTATLNEQIKKSLTEIYEMESTICEKPLLKA
jgi:hypothetical protein